ncbi:YqaE/Pmp3 family membrane protein [Aliivibrio sp. S10_S31]|uniref:YqaE/Pmp3 family membrane protein n=1 Tax=Aliivibrio sp. S10_S31 TaxID=2720224 RepID=UPI0016800785|nr:YqaE/Pmp3 family membrane protein [Aliivibrio sp. S10_S31]MBD1568738.1 YqaE/Pmp3 family membrane protein [Aliivibrio sp. S10_S31]
MNKLFLIILCVLLPPLGVFFAKGVGKDLLINIILTLLFWIPGMIHALWVTTR